MHDEERGFSSRIILLCGSVHCTWNCSRLEFIVGHCYHRDGRVRVKVKVMVKVKIMVQVRVKVKLKSRLRLGLFTFT